MGRLHLRDRLSISKMDFVLVTEMVPYGYVKVFSILRG